MQIIDIVLGVYNDSAVGDAKEKEEVIAQIRHEWKSIPLQPDSDAYRQIKETGSFADKLKLTIKENTNGPWTRLLVGLVYRPILKWWNDFINPPDTEIEPERAFRN